MKGEARTALERAVQKIGGQSATARACGGRIKQGHIWHWLNKLERCPAEYVLVIEGACEGAVTRYELRPDVYGPAPEPAIV